MRSKQIRRMLVAASGVLLLGTFFALGACWHSGIWTWRQFQLYSAMSHECHPVWRDLWNQRIKEGDSLDRVVLRTNPARIEIYGRFTRVSYLEPNFTGVTLFAKDDLLIRADAWSCAWRHTFFNGLSTEDERDLDGEWQAHLARKNAERVKQLSISVVEVAGLLASPPGSGRFLAAPVLIPEILPNWPEAGDPLAPANAGP